MKFQKFESIQIDPGKWKAILKQNLAPGPKLAVGDGFTGCTDYWQPGWPSAQQWARGLLPARLARPRPGEQPRVR
jgi:hypothetical protein